jgi:molecular chaperone Hsp33
LRGDERFDALAALQWPAAVVSSELSPELDGTEVMIESASSVRAPAATVVDDAVMPFQVDTLDLRGRLVRLGPALDEILSRHDYPLPVTKVLGEAIALGVLLGSALKIDGRFIVQTQTDGPISMLVVDFVSPGQVRACARFDRTRVEEASSGAEASAGKLLGRGHLAMTIDQGPEMSRYQGLVPLDEDGLEAAAHEYFFRSEQIPTRVRLAVAEDFRPGPEGLQRRWRAGGMLLQFLPHSPERVRQADLDPGDAPEGVAPHEVAEDEAWVEGRALVETVEDLELIDPALSHERLIYRLFHERGVRVFASHPVVAQCSCSREKITDMLRSFPQHDRDDMVKDGAITVTCEFCSATYAVDPAELAPPN